MRLARVLTFARYEIRRAVARKKVLALVALTILIDTVPYYALAATHTALITPPIRPYIWILGVFLPQAFFLQFIALLIAAGLHVGGVRAGHGRGPALEARLEAGVLLRQVPRGLCAPRRR